MIFTFFGAPQGNVGEGIHVQGGEVGLISLHLSERAMAATWNSSDERVPSQEKELPMEFLI